MGNFVAILEFLDAFHVRITNMFLDRAAARSEPMSTKVCIVPSLWKRSPTAADDRMRR